jgi:hypothetical protein
MDSFTAESACCLETSVPIEKYQVLKDFISSSKTAKEIKKGIYSFNPENAEKEKYNLFINLNEKWARTVYGKTRLSSVEKLITEGIPSSPEKPSNGNISLYAFSNEDKDSRKPLFSSVFIFNEKTLTINIDFFEECIKKAIPPNLIPKKPQGNPEKE